MFATDTHFRALTKSVSGSLVNRLCWRSSTSSGMCSRRGGRLCRWLCPTINFRRLKLLRILERHRVFYVTWFIPLDIHRVGKVAFNPLNLLVQQGKIKIHRSIKCKQLQSRTRHRVRWLKTLWMLGNLSTFPSTLLLFGILWLELVCTCPAFSQADKGRSHKGRL